MIAANPIARAAGFLAGGVLVLAPALATVRTPATGVAAGLPIALRVADSGEAQALPAGTTLQGSLRPRGQAMRGRFTLRNQTAARIVVRPLLRGQRTPVERAVRVELSADGRRVFSGPAAALRRGGERIALGVGESARVAVAVRAERSAPPVPVPVAWTVSFERP